MSTFKGQSEIILSDLYSKIAVVGPDKPQNAKETVKLLKMYGKILNEMVAQTDIMFAVQTTKFYDSDKNIRYDIPDKDIVELIDTVKILEEGLLLLCLQHKGFKEQGIGKPYLLLYLYVKTKYYLLWTQKYMNSQ